ncbi:MAG TPA: ImmA/IrrE family metallo-endopeptidase [Candidatus Saccharimonadales bacterium]|jgi:Zn-dependent peptidase ImmA (M78 family)|nr:ImmA/IrrE family metallo-endopeptidase [Candidatus Saccharimonadales bacterium]
MSYTRVRALAEEYAEKYNPEHVAPFPYENILKAHDDLRIYYTALDDANVSGAILYKDGVFSILINNTKPQTRQHFTLGHELGHYFLHQSELKSESGIIDGDDALDGPKILYRMDNAESQRLEKEANNFAASLLMPADLVRKAWDATGGVEECARIFQVSVVAMSVRVTKMGLISE